jgi:uncharacterized membrane protein YczE
MTRVEPIAHLLTRQQDGTIADVSAIEAVSRRRVSPIERVARLLVGLAAFGFSLGLMIEAGLGLGSWDVLHQGIAERLGVDIGWVVIAVGGVVLAVWIALGGRPGIGTACNVVLVGLALDVTLDVLPTPTAMPIRAGFLLGGVLLNGVATSLYIGARLGPGPRDGLMTALAARGHSIRVARTAIELVVLGIGAVLGGQVGPGTLLYAFAVGPLVQFLLPLCDTAHPDRKSGTEQ